MQKSTGPKTDPCGTPYLTVMNRKKAMSSNCLNRQKTPRVRFCDQQDRMLFFKSKKTSPDRSDLFIAESHETVNRASAVLQECLRRKPD